MRMLQYRLQLMSSGYVVASDDTEGYRPPDEWNDAKLPEIKLEVLACDTYSGKHDILEVVNFAEKGFVPQDILNWRLIRFTVYPKNLILEYYSEELDATQVVDLEKYHKLKLRFHVPRKNGNSDAIYLVEAANYDEANCRRASCYHMRITEYVNNIRRHLRFYEKDSKDESFYDVIVTEYTDF